MDTPGSEASSDSADSTAEPSSAKSTPAAQPAPPLQGQKTLPANDLAVDQDDSDSDISMSAETDDEDEEATRGPSIQVNHIERTKEQPLPLATSDSPVETSNKRKFQEDNANIINGNNINGVGEDVRKRMKPFDDAKSLKTPDVTWRQDKSLLPAEIWHNIFTFLPPRNLGLLLRVNKCFNAYLDPSSSKSSPTPLSRSAVKLLKADTIWKTSRVIYQPGMPAPLKGKSELEMWKLACSFSCQFCGKKQQQNPQPIDQWHPGPGENGNVPIWSFGVRTCGSCLQERTSKVGGGCVMVFSGSLILH
jgi:hypothetical protein